jgi:uncharacterized iron-regulated membrane protein
MTLRTVFFWLHLAAGIVAGAIVLLMSVTGVALTYERQMIAWSDREFKSAPAPGIERMTVERLVEEFRRQNPGQEPTAVTVESGAAEPVAVSVAQRTIYLDAYSGRVLGTANQGMRQAMSKLRAWHRWLAVEGPGRPAARAITGWANLLFLFIVASGIYMWFPRRWTWQTVRAVLLFRPGLRGKARDFNWHNVIGIWSSVPLLIVVASAVPISFPWGTALVYRMVGEEPPAARGGGRGAAAGEAAEGRGRAAGPAPSVDGLSPLLAQAKLREPDWRTINLRLPSAPGAPLVFAIDCGDGGQPHLRSTLTLTRAGDVVSYESFDTLTPGRRIRNVMRFAHTGEVLGLGGQTVAGLVSAGGVVLVWTGIALALRRFLAWVKRRRSPAFEPSSVRQPAA